MKTTGKLFSVAVLAVAAFASVGGTVSKNVEVSGDVVGGTVDVASFTEISASRGVVVNYSSAPQTSVSYKVPESIRDYLEIYVRGSKLYVEFKEGINFDADPATVVTVLGPGVDEFDASTASSINIEWIDRGKLEFNASTAGTITAKVHSASIDADASTAGIINLECVESGKLDVDTSTAACVSVEGELAELDADASTGSIIDAEKASIASGSLESSTGGSIKVRLATRSPFRTKTSSGGTISIR